MQLHSADQLSAPDLTEVVQRYLARLPLAGARRAALAADALTHAQTPSQALRRVFAALAPPAADTANAAYATIGARLRLAVGLSRGDADRLLTRDVQGRERLETTPRLARSPMAPHAWPGRRAPADTELGRTVDAMDEPSTRCSATRVRASGTARTWQPLPL